MSGGMDDRVWVTVSQLTHRRIRNKGRPGAKWIETAREETNGQFSFPVDNEVYLRLCDMQKSGEGIEDVLLRLLTGSEDSDGEGPDAA